MGSKAMGRLCGQEWQVPQSIIVAARRRPTIGRIASSRVVRQDVPAVQYTHPVCDLDIDVHRFLKESAMPKYVIEREMPGAGKLSPQQLQGASQKSCSVLKELGPQI